MNCLRCGKRIAEGREFCDDCLVTVGEPLTDSPYLSTRIVLDRERVEPPKKPEAPPLTPAQEAQKQIAALRKSCAMMSVACVLFALLSCALTVLLLRERATPTETGPRVDPNLGSSFSDEMTEPPTEGASAPTEPPRPLPTAEEVSAAAEE